MGAARVKRAMLILFLIFLLPGLYVLSYYVVFSDTYVWGEDVATSSDKEPIYKYVVGPVPSGFICEGTHDRGAANGTRRFTGNEWPFRFYHPLVFLYNRQEIPEIKRLEDELIKHRADFLR